jgi:hypothetical protein
MYERKVPGVMGIGVKLTLYSGSASILYVNGERREGYGEMWVREFSKIEVRASAGAGGVPSSRDSVPVHEII